MLNFCKDILKKKIKGEEILFTDETKIEMGKYIYDKIKLTNDKK